MSLRITLLWSTVVDLGKVVLWLNTRDCNEATNDGVHIAFGLLISSCLKPSYLLDICCKILIFYKIWFVDEPNSM